MALKVRPSLINSWDKSELIFILLIRHVVATWSCPILKQQSFYRANLTPYSASMYFSVLPHPWRKKNVMHCGTKFYREKCDKILTHVEIHKNIYINALKDELRTYWWQPLLQLYIIHTAVKKIKIANIEGL